MTDLDPRWARALRAQSDLSAPAPEAWAEVRARAAEAGEPTGDADIGAPPSRRRHGVLVAAAAAVVLAAGTIGAVLALPGDDGGHRRLVTGTTTTTTLPLPPAEVEADNTVLQDATHGPELCFLVLTSLPPKCGDVPIANWDWAQVDGEQTVGGTTWGDYHVVGHYDGRNLTLTQRPGPARPHLGTVDPTSPFSLDRLATPPCPTPPGGWQVVDPSKVGLDAYQAFADGVKAQPDFAGMWQNRGGPPLAGLYTVAFSGDLARHEAEIRRVWGGPVCITHHDHSVADLSAVLDRIERDARAGTLGLSLSSSTVDEVGDGLLLVFDWAPVPETTAMIEDRYGVPAKVYSQLQPVSPSPAG